jgi:hypothetical protein
MIMKTFTLPPFPGAKVFAITKTGSAASFVTTAAGANRYKPDAGPSFTAIV